VAKKDPAYDCPACPACGAACGSPIYDEHGNYNQDRWDGPDDATIHCPACGCGWVGTEAELAQARAAVAAWWASRQFTHVGEGVVLVTREPPPAVDPRQLPLFGDGR
jgi:hypothetical protein